MKTSHCSSMLNVASPKLLSSGDSNKGNNNRETYMYENTLRYVPHTKVPLTHVWTETQWDDMTAYLRKYKYSFIWKQHNSLKCPPDVAKDPDLLAHVLYCELEDLPLFINDFKEHHYATSPHVLAWRFEHGI
jgi:hypothetical protein